MYCIIFIILILLKVNPNPTIVTFEFSSQFNSWRIYMNDENGATGYLMPQDLPTGNPPRSNVIAALQEQKIKHNGYVYFRIPEV